MNHRSSCWKQKLCRLNRWWRGESVFQPACLKTSVYAVSNEACVVSSLLLSKLFCHIPFFSSWLIWEQFRAAVISGVAIIAKPQRTLRRLALALMCRAESERLMMINGQAGLQKSVWMS